MLKNINMNCIGCKGKCNRRERLTELPCFHRVCRAYLNRMRLKGLNRIKCPACPHSYNFDDQEYYPQVPWRRDAKGTQIGGTITLEEFRQSLDTDTHSLPQVKSSKTEESLNLRQESSSGEELGKRRRPEDAEPEEEVEQPGSQPPALNGYSRKTASKPAPVKTTGKSAAAARKKSRPKRKPKKAPAKSVVPAKPAMMEARSSKRTIKVPQGRATTQPKAVPPKPQPQDKKSLIEAERSKEKRPSQPKQTQEATLDSLLASKRPVFIMTGSTFKNCSFH